MRFGLAAAAGSVCLLAGCSGVVFNGSDQAAVTARTGAALSGRAFGGQQPLMGAKLYLYAANTTGYGSPSISLLTSATGNPPDTNNNYYVTTAPDGTWGITGDYACPSATSQVYLYLTGGDPGLGSGSNAAVGELAALGTCGNLTPSTFVIINEVSTVAAAFSFAGFTLDATHVGSSGSPQALTGIANAFANASNLENLSTGVIYFTIPSGAGQTYGAKIDTVANILAACVNSAGPASTACATLFADTVYNSVTPTDTATAAINIAHSPAANVAPLYALSVPSPPFLPTLTSQPTDLTLALYFAGNGISSPGGAIIDGKGNVWIGNDSSIIVELSGSGALLSTPSGFAGPNAPGDGVMDDSGDAWLSNAFNTTYSVVELSPAGAEVNNYTAGALNNPNGIAIDGTGDVWVTNVNGNSVTKLSSTGSVLSGTNGFTGGALNQPYYIAIDGSGSAWVVDSGSNAVTKLSSTGAVLSGTNGYTGGGLSGSGRVTIDGFGNAWIPNANSNSLTEISNSGVFLSPAIGFTGPWNKPVSIAIDGSENVWVLNAGGSNLVKIAQTGAFIAGYHPGLTQPNMVTIDCSGNIWIADTGGNNVVEVLGLATPVITPVAAGLPASPTLNGSSNLGTPP